MRKMKRAVIGLLTLLMLAGTSRGQEYRIEISVKAGDRDLKNVPVCVALSLPENVVAPIAFLKSEGRESIGQLTAPGLMTQHIKPIGENKIRKDLFFIIDEMK